MADFSAPPQIALDRKNGTVVNYEFPPILVGNSANPTALVVISHGVGDSGEGWRSTAQFLAGKLPHLLLLLPTAPQQPLTANGGARIKAWFDIYEFADPRNPTKERRADVEGTLTSARYVSHMAGHIAHKHKIPTSRIIFGGFSQGAAISIAAGLTAPYVPRAVMPLSGFFAAATSVIELAKSTPHLDTLIKEKVPFALFHGDQDPVLPLGLARAGLDKLRGLGLNASIKEYPGMAHTTSESEMKDVIAWLAETTA
eukprot:GILI01019390.1.p1 GENE.GILI01019390.1~~GILI01019390.1.p1  ORF type:complete len:256 (+),score=63.86 GILI01019390.1:46-813(+)